MAPWEHLDLLHYLNYSGCSAIIQHQILSNKAVSKVQNIDSDSNLEELIKWNLTTGIISNITKSFAH